MDDESNKETQATNTPLTSSGSQSSPGLVGRKRQSHSNTSYFKKKPRNDAAAQDVELLGLPTDDEIENTPPNHQATVACKKPLDPFAFTDDDDDDGHSHTTDNSNVISIVSTTSGEKDV